MTYLPVCLLVLCITITHCQELQDSLDQVDQQMLILTARLQQLVNQVDNKINNVDEANFAARKLMVKLSKIEVPQCSRRRFACGDSAQCVNSLLVCDGSPDCANGADEDKDLCRLKFKLGKKYTGRTIHDTCILGKDTPLFFSAEKEVRLDYFPAVSKITWTSYLNPENQVISDEFQLTDTAVYTYADMYFSTFCTVKKNLYYCIIVGDPSDETIATEKCYRMNEIDNDNPCSSYVFNIID